MFYLGLFGSLVATILIYVPTLFLYYENLANLVDGLNYGVIVWILISVLIFLASRVKAVTTESHKAFNKGNLYATVFSMLLYVVPFMYAVLTTWKK